MVKANERSAVPNKLIQVPKGIAIGPIFAKQNTLNTTKSYLLGSVIPHGQVS